MKKHRTYQSIRKEYFPWWSIATINRTIKSLEDSGYIIVDNYNKHQYDKTRWFTINLEAVDKLNSVTIDWGSETGMSQNDTRSAQNDTTIPDTPTDTPTDIGGGGTGLTMEQQQALIAMVEFNISKSEAQKWASVHEPADVHGRLRYARDHNLKNPPGFVVSKLQEGKPAPSQDDGSRLQQGQRRAG